MLAGSTHREQGAPFASTSTDEPARVNCLCLERWCSLSCHPCRRIVPPKPAPGHGQSAFGLNKAPLRRLTHEISVAASSPPGSPLTPVSAPAASPASGWCTVVCPLHQVGAPLPVLCIRLVHRCLSSASGWRTLVCPGSASCFLGIMTGSCVSLTLASAPAACATPDMYLQWQPPGRRAGRGPLCQFVYCWSRQLSDSYQDACRLCCARCTTWTETHWIVPSVPASALCALNGTVCALTLLSGAPSAASFMLRSR